MHKKGMSFEMIDWVVKLLFLVAIVFITIFLVRYNVVSAMETQDARSFVFVQRVVSTPSGIAYTDPLTGRTYPYIIDGSKLSIMQQALEQSIVLSANDYIAAQLDLAIGNDTHTFFYNQHAYTQWKKGIIKGNHISMNTALHVLVAQQGKFIPATLTVDLITPKG